MKYAKLIVLFIMFIGGCSSMPMRPVVLYVQPVPTTCIGGYDHFACSNGKNVYGGAYMRSSPYLIPRY